MLKECIELGLINNNNLEITDNKNLNFNDGIIELETGNLSLQQLSAIFNNLPVDITFIDDKDEVKYFSNPKDRVFIRTKSVIGRKVQNCHPQKSLHTVENILNAFKKGDKDKADFWINMQGKMVYIKYFAVRDKDGKYIGTLEVTQDITEIKKIEGEKRLLDWS
jgi:PAS domain S-box-containing protein